MHPFRLALLLIPLLSISLRADVYTDQATGLRIDFPLRWELGAADAVVATAPDRLASILVLPMKDVKDAEEALQRLDLNDVMGSQIKSIRPDEKVISKKINGLPAKIFTGTANIGNVKLPFMAAVVQKADAPAFVVFAFPTNNAHVERIKKSIASIRGPDSK
jgi:hypothetical protein